MTYLFTDIENFTTLSESIDTQNLAPLLNAYFDGVTQIVLRRQGMVDKFIGDAVFAIFNAPVDLLDHAEQAVRCALEIDAFAESFRKNQNAVGLALGPTRIGVHSGPAIVGNFGSSARFNYTAQGDAVNIASRLEGLNKQFGTRISVSAATMDLCKDIAFRPVGSIVLKGKTMSIEVWEPLYEGAMTAAYLESYRSAYARLKGGAPDALALFEALGNSAPDDPCVRLHLARLRRGDSGSAIVMAAK